MCGYTWSNCCVDGPRDAPTSCSQIHVSTHLQYIVVDDLNVFVLYAYVYICSDLRDLQSKVLVTNAITLSMTPSHPYRNLPSKQTLKSIIQKITDKQAELDKIFRVEHFEHKRLMRERHEMMLADHHSVMVERYLLACEQRRQAAILAEKQRIQRENQEYIKRIKRKAALTRTLGAEQLAVLEKREREKMFREDYTMKRYLDTVKLIRRTIFEINWECMKHEDALAHAIRDQENADKEWLQSIELQLVKSIEATHVPARSIQETYDYVMGTASFAYHQQQLQLQQEKQSRKSRRLTGFRSLKMSSSAKTLGGGSSSLKSNDMSSSGKSNNLVVSASVKYDASYFSPNRPFLSAKYVSKKLQEQQDKQQQQQQQENENNNHEFMFHVGETNIFDTTLEPTGEQTVDAQTVPTGDDGDGDISKQSQSPWRSAKSVVNSPTKSSKQTQSPSSSPSQSPTSKQTLTPAMAPIPIPELTDARDIQTLINWKDATVRRHFKIWDNRLDIQHLQRLHTHRTQQLKFAHRLTHTHASLTQSEDVHTQSLGLFTVRSLLADTTTQTLTQLCAYRHTHTQFTQLVHTLTFKVAYFGVCLHTLYRLRHELRVNRIATRTQRQQMLHTASECEHTLTTLQAHIENLCAHTQLPSMCQQVMNACVSVFVCDMMSVSAHTQTHTNTNTNMTSDPCVFVEPALTQEIDEDALEQAYDAQMNAALLSADTHAHDADTHANKHTHGHRPHYMDQTHNSALHVRAHGNNAHANTHAANTHGANTHGAANTHAGTHGANTHTANAASAANTHTTTIAHTTNTKKVAKLLHGKQAPTQLMGSNTPHEAHTQPHTQTATNTQAGVTNTQTHTLESKSPVTVPSLPSSPSTQSHNKKSAIPNTSHPNTHIAATHTATTTQAATHTASHTHASITANTHPAANLTGMMSALAASKLHQHTNTHTNKHTADTFTPAPLQEFWDPIFKSTLKPSGGCALAAPPLPPTWVCEAYTHAQTLANAEALAAFNAAHPHLAHTHGGDTHKKPLHTVQSHGYGQQAHTQHGNTHGNTHANTHASAHTLNTHTSSVQSNTSSSTVGSTTANNASSQNLLSTIKSTNALKQTASTTSTDSSNTHTTTSTTKTEQTSPSARTHKTTLKAVATAHNVPLYMQNKANKGTTSVATHTAGGNCSDEESDAGSVGSLTHTLPHTLTHTHMSTHALIHTLTHTFSHAHNHASAHTTTGHSTHTHADTTTHTDTHNDPHTDTHKHHQIPGLCLFTQSDDAMEYAFIQRAHELLVFVRTYVCAYMREVESVWKHAHKIAVVSFVQKLYWMMNECCEGTAGGGSENNKSGKLCVYMCVCMRGGMCVYVYMCVHYGMYECVFDVCLFKQVKQLIFGLHKITMLSKPCYWQCIRD
jgi:hypothetical protein